MPMAVTMICFKSFSSYTWWVLAAMSIIVKAFQDDLWLYVVTEQEVLQVERHSYRVDRLRDHGHFSSSRDSGFTTCSSGTRFLFFALLVFLWHDVKVSYVKGEDMNFLLLRLGEGLSINRFLHYKLKMRKWFQKKMEEPNKRRLTRKERYLKKYLNFDKCFDFFVSLPTLINGNYVGTVRKYFPAMEALLEKENQEKYVAYLNCEVSNPILAIFAVGFHHKRGSEIEFCYPDLNQLTPDAELIRNLVTVYALPDAVHNADEDYLYFNLQARINGERRMLFGVTCFKQIRVTEEMRKQDSELTRGHLQKAICLLSLQPLFGYLKNRLEPTIRAYFELQNFKDMSLIQFAYENISRDRIKDISLHMSLQDTNLTALLYTMRDRTTKLLKAVLLELKIVVFSLSSSICSKFIISLLALLPGMLQFRMYSSSLNALATYLDNFGLPLQIFSQKYPLFMHFSVNDLPALDDKQIKGYLIGTTNKFVRTLGKLDPDVVIDIDADQVQITKEAYKKLLNNKLNDKQLFNNIHNNVLKSIDSAQGLTLKRFQFVKQQEQYEEYIRKQFWDYAKSLLVETSYLLHNLQQFDLQITKLATIRTRKSMLSKQEISPEQYDNSSEEEDSPEKELDDGIHKHKVELIKELGVKELRNKISSAFKQICKYNRKVVLHWLTQTGNGATWQQNHDSLIHIYSDGYDENLKCAFNVSESGNVFIGDQNLAIIFEAGTGKLYQGQSKNFQKHGEGKYESWSDRSYSYKGSFLNNKAEGEGQMIVKDEFQYHGRFEQGKFHGYGNLQKAESVYEGQFKEGSYQGTGKLIMPNQDCYVGLFEQGEFHGEGQYVWKNGDIYKGMFKHGRKHGTGIFQSKDYSYDGEWVDDMKEGVGEITLTESGERIQANFKGDKVVETEQVMIKYPDNSLYQGTLKNRLGYIKNLKPHGRGQISYQDGTVREGEFLDGLLRLE